MGLDWLGCMGADRDSGIDIIKTIDYKEIAPAKNGGYFFI